MAEMFNNLSGDSSAQYNNYNNVQGAKVNTGGKDGEYSHNWKRTPRPFGLNVRVPQAPIGTRSHKLVAEIIKEMALARITHYALRITNINLVTTIFYCSHNIFYCREITTFCNIIKTIIPRTWLAR